MSGGKGGSAAASNRTVFWISRVLCSSFARLSRIPRLLLVLDDRLLHVEPALGDALEVGELDLLGPLVEIGVVLDPTSTCLSNAFWAVVELLPGLVLGDLGLVLELLVELAGLVLERLERVVLGPLLAEADERLVAGQHVHAVEHERDVVEVEVLGLVGADPEELLADHVEVGDGDHVEVGAGGFWSFFSASFFAGSAGSGSAGAWP